MITSLLKKHQISILATMLVAILVGIGVSLFQPMEYRSGFSILVIEKQPSLDGYAAAKAAERLTTSLGEVLGTATFIEQVHDQVKDTALANDETIFPSDEQKRREEWKRDVTAQVLPSVGMLKIAVYHHDRTAANDLATAVAKVLVDQGPTYLGGQNIVLNVVDAPLTSKRPVRPNYLVNALAAMAVGFGVAFGFHALRFTFASRANETLEAVPEYAQPVQQWNRPSATGPRPLPRRSAPSVTPHHVEERKHVPHLQSMPMTAQYQEPAQVVYEEPEAVEPTTSADPSITYTPTATITDDPGVWRMP